ncbi:hypothetical protein [Jeotgalibacillus proteolyticus]|uniref:Uncharacterized protein n=1 Tax=Jeotgalibacillus proteolyticus TaxID=2082395 RepID=A0A2S5GAW7_9BACL|nr:hypothetical protein [Jeotgalibacillus proteolyticus]PPA70177.1 hypothetical protein C4B60_11360 [Jeotgalibacillus proteolyticus]
MTINFNTTDMQNKWKNQLSNAKKNYKKERLVREYDLIINEIDRYKENIQQQANAQLERNENQLKSIAKPKEPERKKGLDIENVQLLSYYAKIIQSKLSVEADNQVSFLKLIEEMRNHKEEDMKWALLDSYHEILAAGRALTTRIENQMDQATDKSVSGGNFSRVGIDSEVTFESKLREQYVAVKQSLKDPAQVKREEENEQNRGQIEKDNFHINISLSQAVDALNSTKANYQREKIFTEDEKKGHYFH